MHKRALPAVAATLAAVGCGSGPVADDLPPLPTRDPPTLRAITPPETPRASSGDARRVSPRDTPRRVAAPVRVVIPKLGVDARLIRLGLDASGALEVPERFDEAGWWTGGARPGERGPAVIAGHVDSTRGPAVFYALGKLRRGDRVIVRRRDGTRVRFTVRRRERVRKDHFPTRRVYGPTRRATLRLITCSGAFDRSSGHYLDNTVVYATAS